MTRFCQRRFPIFASCKKKAQAKKESHGSNNVAAGFEPRSLLVGHDSTKKATNLLAK